MFYTKQLLLLRPFRAFLATMVNVTIRTAARNTYSMTVKRLLTHPWHVIQVRRSVAVSEEKPDDGGAGVGDPGD